MKNCITEQFWYVKQIHIFRDLAEPDAHALERIATFKELKHEEHLSAEGVYLLKAGRVKIYENLLDTEPETKAVLEPGELFGMVAAEVSPWENTEPHSLAETLTEAHIGFVTVRDFTFFLKRKPHLALPLRKSGRFRIPDRLLWNWHNRPGLQTKTTIVPSCKHANAFANIAFRCAASRLALLLLNLTASAKACGNSGFIPRLSTRRLSKLIGSSVETTETLLKTFKQHGLLDRRWGRTQVLDMWRLKKIADAKMQTPISYATETSIETLTPTDSLENPTRYPSN